MKVVVTLTKTEWPYTKVQRKDVELKPGQKISQGDGWLIANVSYVSEQHILTEVEMFKTPADVAAGDPNPGSFADKEGQWLTWPPERELIVGHEYLVRTKFSSQQYQREWRMSFLGNDQDGTQFIFNARPAAGTQTLTPDSIFATKDLGPSAGRDDAKRYVNKTTQLR
jgi:hypothetical protein